MMTRDAVCQQFSYDRPGLLLRVASAEGGMIDLMPSCSRGIFYSRILRFTWISRAQFRLKLFGGLTEVMALPENAPPIGAGKRAGKTFRCFRNGSQVIVERLPP